MIGLPVVTGEFRVAADPVLRFAPSGVAVCKLRAVASSRKKVNEEWVDDKTCWVNLTGFKRTAENMAESFQKGDLVTVVGKIQTEDWEDKDGGKRTSVDIVCDSIGAAVTFAVASVHKAERVPAGGGGRSPADEDPWAAPVQPEDPPF